MTQKSFKYCFRCFYIKIWDFQILLFFSFAFKVQLSISTLKWHCCSSYILKVQAVLKKMWKNKNYSSRKWKRCATFSEKYRHLRQFLTNHKWYFSPSWLGNMASHLKISSFRCFQIVFHKSNTQFLLLFLLSSASSCGRQSGLIKSSRTHHSFWFATHELKNAARCQREATGDGPVLPLFCHTHHEHATGHGMQVHPFKSAVYGNRTGRQDRGDKA